VNETTILAAIKDRIKGEKLNKQQEEEFKAKFGFKSYTSIDEYNDEDLVSWLFALVPRTKPINLLKILYDYLSDMPFLDTILGQDRDQDIIIDAE
jgi:hypothetical protein